MTNLKRSSEEMTDEEAEAMGREIEASWHAGDVAFAQAQRVREDGVSHRRAGWAITAVWGVGASVSAPVGATIAATAGAFAEQPMALALGAAALMALAFGAWKKGQAARLSVEAIVSTADKVQNAVSTLTAEKQKIIVTAAVELSKDIKASAFSRVLAVQMAKQRPGQTGLASLSKETREMSARDVLRIDFAALRKAQKELEQKKAGQDAKKKKPRV